MNRQDMRKLRAAIREKATRMELDLKERQKTKWVNDKQLSAVFTYSGIDYSHLYILLVVIHTSDQISHIQWDFCSSRKKIHLVLLINKH